MKVLRLLVFLLALGAALGGCKPDRTEVAGAVNIIPAGADMLFAVDLQAVLKKVVFSGLDTSTFYRAMISDLSAEAPVISTILANPENSGIDLAQKLYLSFDFDNRHTGGRFGGIFFGLKNAGLLAAAMTKATSAPVQKGLHCQYIQSAPYQLVAWNDNYAAIIYTDWDETLSAFPAILFKEGAPSAVRHGSVRAWLETSADLAHWTSLENLANWESTGWLARLLANTKVLQRSYIHSYVNFGNGLAEWKSRFHFHRRLHTNLDLLFKKQTGFPFWEILPGTDLEGAFILGTSARGINQFLLEKYAWGPVKAALGNCEADPEAILKTLDGDLAIAYYQHRKTGRESILAAIAISDLHRLTLIFQNDMQKYLLQKGNHRQYFLPHLSLSSLLVKDNLLFLSNSPGLIETIASGKYDRAPASINYMPELVRQKIAAGIAVFPASSFGLSPQEIPAKRFQLSADRQGVTGELIFKKQEQNALPQLLQIMAKAYEYSGRKVVSHGSAEN